MLQTESVPATLRVMNQKPLLADVMTTAPITVETTQPLSEVYTLLQNRSFHHVPVVDGDKPIGMIAASDILKLVYDIEGSDDFVLMTMLDHQFNIEDAMTAELITALHTDPLKKVADLMADGSLHSVVVVDDAGDLAGIVTSSDLIRQLSKLL